MGYATDEFLHILRNKSLGGLVSDVVGGGGKKVQGFPLLFAGSSIFFVEAVTLVVENNSAHLLVESTC